jgi:hypothetical protein
MKEIEDAMKDGMTDVDHDLKHALQREEPPAGFADRVLLRVAEPPQAKHRARTLPFQTLGPTTQTWGPPSGGPIRLKPDSTDADVGAAFRRTNPAEDGSPVTRFKLPFVQWAAAAALVAAVAGGVDYIAKQEQRAEGEAAKERVVQALHIAGSKLQLVQTRISRMHEPPAKNSNPIREP